ncbi:hypothetical protein ZHAS_00008644 [Anopheles sinensis]|uniref:Uncharacterized protein n=1 Tax=Anopheles sinensis TaxID=74873 RepID=A0A084VST3_ANOSI|nr:hypothetical protein ZHAS_00008644 [Anopheles sinensis]
MFRFVEQSGAISWYSKLGTDLSSAGRKCPDRYTRSVSAYLPSTISITIIIIIIVV